jgi:molybdopterin synthase catalytic subunit
MDSQASDRKYFVLLFGSLKDRLQRESIEVTVPEPNVGALLKSCGEQYPELAPWLPYVRVAVNCEYAAPDTAIHVEDEIALLPPVAGGQSTLDEVCE